MGIDISRRTFVKEKHYADVLTQQGRMLLDADLNELGEIRRYDEAKTRADVCGTWVEAAAPNKAVQP